MGCDQDGPERPEVGSLFPMMGTRRTGLCLVGGRGTVGVVVSQGITLGPV